MKLTRSEASAWIRKAKPRTQFSAHVDMNQVIVDSEEEYYRGGAHLAVTLSRPAALKMVRDYLTDKTEADGRRIPCKEHRSGDYVCYWIG